MASLTPWLAAISAPRLRFACAIASGPENGPGALITIGQSSATAASKVSRSTSKMRSLSAPSANSQPYSQPSVTTGSPARCTMSITSRVEGPARSSA